MNGLIDINIIETLDGLLNKKLDGKDYDIVSSFKNYYQQKGILTERQKSYLSNIMDRYSQSSEEWANSFDDEKRSIFKMAIKYYYNTPYFLNVIQQYEMNKDYIPSRRQYEKMCENKYFLRAVENYKTPPKYSIGDMVCWRKSIYRGKNCSIGLVEAISDVPSYHYGNRRYSILWLDDGTKLETAERNIKLYREPKKKA